jgi:hypothetical protein|tara:strand:+ start:666 stop:1073 length:408 start_codon:yes stop_codon:yes gene_type:complete
MTKKYKVAELNAVVNLISKCKNDKDLKNPSTTLSGIRLMRKIDTITKKFQEEQTELFKIFEVEQSDKDGMGYYDWTNKEPELQAKIVAALNELTNTEYEVEGFNAIDAEDFVIYTRGLDNQTIVFLYDYLVKDTD